MVARRMFVCLDFNALHNEAPHQHNSPRKRKHH